VRIRLCASRHFAVLQGKHADEVSPGRIGYELQRLRLHGLIEPIPTTHLNRLTDEGLQVALLITRVQNGILLPTMASVVQDPPLASAPALLQFHAGVNSRCGQPHIAAQKKLTQLLQIQFSQRIQCSVAR
jgi:hypothetical protein